jgi:hypothetical protein
MRATVMLALAVMTAIAHPAVAQEAEPRPGPAAVKSTLKPAPAPGADTSRPRQRLVTVFGTEACPAPTSADEIVVCARLPESEIYRIPERLRQAENRQSVFTNNRSLLLGDGAGGAGGSIGSCSAVGAGGMIGCSRNQVDAWANDRTNRMGYTEETPR